MKTVAEIFRSYGVLDKQGRHVNGTDKMTNHLYGDAYEQIIDKHFSPRLVSVPMGYGGRTCLGIDPDRRPARERVDLMMEVGVADGSSLLAWRDIFPNAVCVGLDIHHSDKAHGERIEFHLGDQRVKGDCESSAAGRQFDFIVEDATHKLENTLLTLYWLWPFVRPGGLYVVEEWENVDRTRIKSLWPSAEVVDTQGPFGGVESLVVFRKPM